MKSYLKEEWYKVEEIYLNKEAETKRIRTKVEKSPKEKYNNKKMKQKTVGNLIFQFM